LGRDEGLLVSYGSTEDFELKKHKRLLGRSNNGTFRSSKRYQSRAAITPRASGVSRHCRIEDIRRWMEPFLALRFYRTLDLSGDEFAQPIENFKPIYRLARVNGLRLKAHVGEWGDADSVWRAVEELELDEVQHGIAAADSPAVMRFLADHRIRLNVCPTSNLMLSRVESLKRRFALPRSSHNATGPVDCIGLPQTIPPCISLGFLSLCVPRVER
jgi:hypothetical protein